MSGADIGGERLGLRPDGLEPYTVRAVFVAGTHVADAMGMVASLLEDIGRGCQAAGCSVIGHIKSHVRTPGFSFHCNLTSLRTGARCGAAGRTDVAPRPLRPGGSLECDLAVLVYGITRDDIDAVVRDAVRAAATRDAGEWTLWPAEAALPRDPDHARLSAGSPVEELAHPTQE